MPFKHKLSRRLATLFVAFAALSLGACGETPTESANDMPVIGDYDPALALNASNTVGQRVTTGTRYVQILAAPSRNATVIGTQTPGRLGTIVEGPTAVTFAEPYPLWRINFDTGVDGWALGVYLSPVSAPAPAPVATVTVAPTAVSLSTGATSQLSATLRDASGNTLTGRAIAWTSANPAVATVNSAGLVTAVAAGTVVVTATSETRTGSSNITVTAPTPVPVASISIAPTTVSLVAGATAQLTATLRDALGTILTGRTISWTSANASVATVNSNGLVTAVAAGTVVVSATSGGITGTRTVTVTAPAPAPVASVTVAPGSVSLLAGATTQLSATLRDAQGNALTGRTITWASMNSGVASVNASGLVTAVAAGTVLVSATSEGRSGTTTVTVTAPPPPPPPSGSSGLFWSSDWSTASGTAANSLQDGGRWSMIGGVGLEVVSSAGLNFPSTNVLRVTAVQQTTGFAMLRKVGLGAMANGQSRFYRYYARFTMPDGLSDNQTHPIQDGNAGSQINWMWSILHNTGGAGWFTPTLGVHTNNGFDNAQWSPPALRKGVTYRFEHQVVRVSATQFQLHVRIYDAAGTLLYDDDDFRNRNGTLTLANNPLFLWNDAANIDGLNAGNNGIGGTPTWPFVYGYQAAFAVCATNWCGPYVAGEGR